MDTFVRKDVKMLSSIQDLALFVQVAELRSFVMAGKQMGVSASAVGKRISRMEARLQVTLFKRTTRSITLTAEGRHLLERALGLLQELDSIQHELGASLTQAKGKLRISLPPISDVFLDHFAQFNSLYPDIELELDYSDKLVDIIEDGFDFALRTGADGDHALKAVKAIRLGSFRRVMVASEAYLAQHGAPRDIGDLLRHKCLHYRSPNTGKVEAWHLGHDDAIQLPPSLVCNSIEARKHFALKGLGIAYLPDISIARELREGKLTPVLPQLANGDIPVSVLWSRNKRETARHKAFIDFFDGIKIDAALKPG